MAEVIKTTIQFRRGVSTTWAKNNPILAYGEPGFEKDTNRLKIGDGMTHWNELQYFSEGGYSIAPDNKSIILNNGQTLSLYGLAEAAEGEYPARGENGELIWKKPCEPLLEEEIREVIGDQNGG